MSQISQLKSVLKFNINDYVEKEFVNLDNKEKTITINELEDKSDQFLKDLKKCAQHHLQPFGTPIGLNKEDIEKKKDFLKDTIFAADSSSPTQIVWHGKKHQDYYSIHITDLQNLILHTYLQDGREYLRCHALDKLILEMLLYYHVVATGETISEGISFSNMAVSHYFKGRSMVTALFKWCKEIAFMSILFGIPLLLSFNSYYNSNENFPIFFTLTSIWYLLFFPRYLLNKYIDMKEQSYKSHNYIAYNNLWLGCFFGATHLEYMKNTIQNLIASRNMIFESALKTFLDYLIKKYGKSF